MTDPLENLTPEELEAVTNNMRVISHYVKIILVGSGLEGKPDLNNWIKTFADTVREKLDIFSAPITNEEWLIAKATVVAEPLFLKWLKDNGKEPRSFQCLLITPDLGDEPSSVDAATLPVVFNHYLLQKWVAEPEDEFIQAVKALTRQMMMAVNKRIDDNPTATHIAVNITEMLADGDRLSMLMDRHFPRRKPTGEISLAE